MQKEQLEQRYSEGAGDSMREPCARSSEDKQYHMRLSAQRAPGLIGVASYVLLRSLYSGIRTADN